MKEYGVTVRAIRQNKQILQKEVYDGLVVKSFAIRFEKGEVMLQYETFLAVLKRINLTPEEFHYIHNDYQKIQDKTLWLELTHAINNQNDRKLQSIYQKYRDSKIVFVKILALLANALCDYNPQRVDPHAAINQSELKEIYSYFKNQENWTLDEINIFSTCYYIFPSLEQQRLIKRCYPSLRKYKGYDNYNERMIYLLSNYLLGCYHKGDLKEANAWFVKLKSVVTTRDELNLKLRQRLCEAYYYYGKGQYDEGNKLFKAYTDSLCSFGLDSDAELAYRQFKKFKDLMTTTK